VVINQCVTEQDESHNASDSDSWGIDKSDLQNDLKQDIAHVILRAQMKMGQSNLVSDGIKEVLLTIKDHFVPKLNAVMDKLPVGDPKELLSEVVESIETLPNVICDVSTVYARNKLLCNEMGMVKPVDCHLGTHYENRYSKENGCMQKVPVADTFQYVSILDTIMFVLKFLPLNSLQQQSARDCLTEYCDGDRYNSSSFFQANPKAIQVHLYFDEFETVNPLGSKTKVHKLGAIYMMLRNLPTYLNSRLKHIHLVSLFYTEDVKKYGYDAILTPLVKDLQNLENNGIVVANNTGTSECIKGALILISSDNLGAHSLFGFKESFAGNCICRVCYATYDDSQHLFSEEDFQLRSATQHESDVLCSQTNPDNVKCTGVKRPCSFNKLQQFNIITNYCLDAMHDIFEGVFPLEVKAVLQHFILDLKLFDLNKLNSRLSNFPYLRSFLKDKPSLISADRAKES
jgi:hypothetical protein